MSDKVSRRDLLAGALGAAAGAGALAGGAVAQEPAATGAVQDPPATAPAPQAAPQGRPPLFFLTEDEARFLAAAVDRLIPPDDEFAGAAGAGVVTFIDRQLASDWGAGARMYLRGPWDPDAPPQQGYQLRHPPAEIYRIGIAELRRHCTDAYGGREFWDLTAEVQDEVLKGVEQGAVQLPSLPGAYFFETMLANTVEGYFADPVYGGNRDMVGWRLVGYPGAYAAYPELVDAYDFDYRREPIAIGNEAARQAHIHGHDHAGGG